MIKSESCWWKGKRSEHGFYAAVLVDSHLHILGSMVTTRTLTNSKVLQYRVYPVTEDLVIPQSGKTLCMVQAHTDTHTLSVKFLPADTLFSVTEDLGCISRQRNTLLCVPALDTHTYKCTQSCRSYNWLLRLPLLCLSSSLMCVL